MPIEPSTFADFFDRIANPKIPSAEFEISVVEILQDILKRTNVIRLPDGKFFIGAYEKDAAPNPLFEEYMIVTEDKPIPDSHNTDKFVDPKQEGFAYRLANAYLDQLLTECDETRPSFDGLVKAIERDLTKIAGVTR
jgi:hypothetical protein